MSAADHPHASNLAAALMVPAGALVGHGAAYALGGGANPSGPGHDHMPAMAGAAAPLALVALAWFARQGATGASSALPRLRLLIVLQPLVFLAQEGLEHALGGHGLGSFAHSSVLRVGVVAQVLVAGLSILLVRAARATGRAVAAIRSRRRPRRDDGVRLRPTAPGHWYCTPLGMPTSERGPPHLLAIV